MNATEILRLSYALIEAENKAVQVYLDNPEDGGTCNFDNCLVKLPRMSTDDITCVRLISGVTLGDVHYSSKKYRTTGIALLGQGNLRTRMAEMINRVMQEHGYESMMFYQMD